MSYQLFLDDMRTPRDVRWVELPLGPWVVARSFDSFTKVIIERGMPDFIAFDHDLADEHYTLNVNYSKYKEKTGFDCAKWLVEYCMNNSMALPAYVVHSMNPIGKGNIESLLKAFNDHNSRKTDGPQV